ncbi:nucleotidyltransferase domain-containing protein [Tsukamurella soli]|uniref:Nucleotidyltransferase n=1 Tax=Tsukamurella soli TaxID=644556 RepID=A0ABP8JJQ9_9ACTN
MSHGGERNREIAEGNLILLGEVGSTLHGINVAEQDDLDLMGVCVEPKSCVMGLERFEQYIWRTQPEGVRSGPGDIDKTIYSLRKWVRLAAAGNPTVLILGFAPANKVHYSTPEGAHLMRNMDLFASKQAAGKFIGYCNSQLEQLRGTVARRHTNRPELIEKYGYDVKFGAHAVRLGVQGIEFLTTGRISLPMPEPWRSTLVSMRTGGISYAECCVMIDEQLDKLRAIEKTADLPDRPDSAVIDRFLIKMHESWWNR